MIYGKFDENGFPLGFWDTEACSDPEAVIPDDAVNITDAQHVEFMENAGSRRFVDGEVFEYVPPFVEPPAPPITRRQLRLTLVRNGISLSTVENAISDMPEGLPKEEAQIEWADASTFNRNHPTLLLIAGALGLTEAQVDAMWAEAENA
ncbi:hypothetical protein ATCR1_06831 [Agrobacterium tumefaciens CCNWGS0286]|uniref:hypothetical protein n=1 Tax=Agrobacterium tumefaciens TaxID=358 RepID=UPI0002334B1E|nr:hypothetical protein [Agrobacterium tumefaciens]EHH07561.1 hypothetical protein ATCR1_06831 [Agrobacterium tumefaciens CCNWGS0286]